MIDSGDVHRLLKKPVEFKDAKNKETLIISPDEQVELDGFSLDAVPSFTVQTLFLK